MKPLFPLVLLLLLSVGCEEKTRHDVAMPITEVGDALLVYDGYGNVYSITYDGYARSSYNGYKYFVKEVANQDIIQFTKPTEEPLPPQH